MTEGPPRYYVPIPHDPRRSPQLCYGGAHGYVRRTREEAEARPVIWIEDIEAERKEKPCKTDS